MHAKPTHKRGFTLLELSLVLVIIGLVIGGIFAGKSLITASYVRGIISDADKFKAAVRTFQTKYNCIPGDCDHASAFNTLATNGDGDGRIGYLNTGNPTINLEMAQAWYHLSLAGLIEAQVDGVSTTNNSRFMEPGINAPHSRLGTDVGYTIGFFAGLDSNVENDWSPCLYCKWSSHTLLLGRSSYLSTETYEPAFSPRIAYGVDSKVDDGMPGNGKVTSRPYSSVWDGAYPPATYGYCSTNNDPITAQYELTNTSEACSLYFPNYF